MKVAVNRDYGGFGLSADVYNELGIAWDGYGYLRNEDLNIQSGNYYAYRSDPRLIAAIEKIGEENASGKRACVRIVEIPDDVNWRIDDDNGVESVHEVHRSW